MPVKKLNRSGSFAANCRCEGKLMYEDCPSYKLYYTYDANGTLSGIKKVLSSGTTITYS